MIPSLEEFKKDYLTLCSKLSLHWQENKSLCNWHRNTPDGEMCCEIGTTTGCCSKCSAERKRHNLKPILGDKGCTTTNLLCNMFHCVDEYKMLPDNNKDIADFFAKYKFNENINGTIYTSFDYVIMYYHTFEEICERYMIWEQIYNTLSSIPYNKIMNDLNNIFLWDKVVFNDSILKDLISKATTTFKQGQQVLVKDLGHTGTIIQVAGDIFKEYVIRVGKNIVFREESLLSLAQSL
jgi:hypothetical protein